MWIRLRIRPFLSSRAWPWIQTGGDDGEPLSHGNDNFTPFFVEIGGQVEWAAIPRGEDIFDCLGMHAVFLVRLDQLRVQQVQIMHIALRINA